MDLISVIIPTYNRKNTLPRAIDSVVKQSYSNWELIIVDDCSTDNTLELIQEKYGHMDNLQYIINDVNLGAGKSRNVGVKYANGDYIAFLDSDDEWNLDNLKFQMQQMKYNQDINMSYCFMERRVGDTIYDVWPPKDTSANLLSGNIFNTILCNSLIGPPTMLIKKSAFENLSGFTELPILEDYEFTLRFSEKYKIGLCNYTGVIQHFSNDGINANNQKKIEVYVELLDKYYDTYVQKGLLTTRCNNIMDELDGNNKAVFLKMLVGRDKEGYLSYVKSFLRG